MPPIFSKLNEFLFDVAVLSQFRADIVQYQERVRVVLDIVCRERLYGLEDLLV